MVRGAAADIAEALYIHLPSLESVSGQHEEIQLLLKNRAEAPIDVLRLCSIRHFVFLSVPTKYADCLIALFSRERMMLCHASAAGKLDLRITFACIDEKLTMAHIMRKLDCFT